MNIRHVPCVTTQNSPYDYDGNEELDQARDAFVSFEGALAAVKLHAARLVHAGFMRESDQIGVFNMVDDLAGDFVPFKTTIRAPRRREVEASEPKRVNLDDEIQNMRKGLERIEAMTLEASQ